MRSTITIGLIVLVTLGVILYMRFRNVYDRIEFDAEYVDIEVDRSNPLAWIQQGQVTVRTLIKVTVQNGNDLKIPIKDLKTQIFYNGQMVGQTPPETMKRIEINPGSYTEWIEAIDIYAKNDAIKGMMTQLFNGQDPIVDYTISMKIYGIRYRFSGRVNVTEEIASAW